MSLSFLLYNSKDNFANSDGNLIYDITVLTFLTLVISQKSFDIADSFLILKRLFVATVESVMSEENVSSK